MKTVEAHNAALTGRIQLPVRDEDVDKAFHVLPIPPVITDEAWRFIEEAQKSFATAERVVMHSDDGSVCDGQCDWQNRAHYTWIK